MPGPTGKGATFADLQLPRRKAIRFLEGVQRQMLKAARNGGGEIVARIELTGLDGPPNYSVERPNGERLQVLDGAKHKPLADEDAVDLSRSWSKATMSFDAVYDLLMSLAWEELEFLSGSGDTAS